MSTKSRAWTTFAGVAWPPILLLAASLPGCASLALQFGGPETFSYPGPAIYSGTICDVGAVAGAFTTEGEGSIGALLIFDLPFSLVMDTLLLPLTIYETCTGTWPLRSGPPPQQAPPEIQGPPKPPPEPGRDAG